MKYITISVLSLYSNKAYFYTVGFKGQAHSVRSPVYQKLYISIFICSECDAGIYGIHILQNYFASTLQKKLENHELKCFQAGICTSANAKVVASVS